MNKSTVITGLLMLGLGLGGGYWLAGNTGNQHVTEAGAEKSGQPSGDDAREILFYRSPMNPSVTSPTPAKDPMGMEYVAVYADPTDNTTDSAGTVKIDPVMVQNMGVRTAVAERTSMSRAIRAVGRIDFNEESMVRIHPKVEGWIDEVRVDKTGETVKNDAILLSIYSPKLVSTQQEYLLALNNLKTQADSPFEDIRRGAQELVNSSRQRLQMLDVPEHQIRYLEKTHQVSKFLHIHSPVAGTVIRIGARKGQFVMPNTELYMMVNLDRVWVYADVYEYEIPWVKIGDAVEISLTSVPGRTFKGKLAYIYPYAEAKTRTTKVRIVVNNPELLLRPDMFAEVSINSDTRLDVVVIPAEAVIRSGDRTQVFVLREPGKFEPRLVKLGFESKGKVVVQDGIEAGEKVVTSAQFLVDSESKLREATAKMMEGKKELKTNPDSADDEPAEIINDHGPAADADAAEPEAHAHD
jgi:Cu(I)/Ag(I) efflux system membrane fusion protein